MDRSYNVVIEEFVRNILTKFPVVEIMFCSCSIRNELYQVVIREQVSYVLYEIVEVFLMIIFFEAIVVFEVVFERITIVIRQDNVMISGAKLLPI